MLNSTFFRLALLAPVVVLFTGCEQPTVASPRADKEVAENYRARLIAASGGGESSESIAGESASADAWGTIKGRLVYQGPPPQPQKLTVDKDTAVCTKHYPVDESLVVSEQGGLANAFVYLRPKGKVAIHPDYEAAAGEQVALDNEFCSYKPHAAFKLTTQPLLLKNADTVAHNVKGDMVKNPSFNVLVPAKSEVERTDLTKPELLPCPIGCNIHPWMKGWLLVRDDPYAAVTDADGNFEIKNVPVGNHEFQLWQEKVGYLDGVEVQGKPAAKGRFPVAVTEGEVDLGEITVLAKLFEGK